MDRPSFPLPEQEGLSASRSFPIVGIGASAGGLEAFTQLLSHLPGTTGMAYVLVQHLAPTHVSLLADLLARATRMPVLQVQDQMAVEPDHVYVIPPNVTMTLLHGVLRLTARTQDEKPHFSIDIFFRSLAQQQRGQAIGVILSGTGSDGTLGNDLCAGGSDFPLLADATECDCRRIRGCDPAARRNCPGADADQPPSLSAKS